MNDAKPWYTSKTIWGSLIAVGAALGSGLGYTIDGAMQQQMTDALVQLTAVAGSLVAVFGRLTATTRIE